MYLTITTIIRVNSSVPTTATHAIASIFSSLGFSVASGLSEGFSDMLLVTTDVLDIVDLVEVLDSVEELMPVEVLVSVELLDSAVVVDFVEVLVVLDDWSKNHDIFK